jgi:RNA polymerase sigma-70 factor (ECF subfamily)
MAHLQRAIDQLKEPYRSIVILREIEDFQYDEICGALDLPMSSVKVYLHRGRKMLRKTLGEVLHIENA